jgi:hypothetical protein
MSQLPGILPNLDLNTCGTVEIGIVKNLSVSWFVTRIETKIKGKDRFYSVFLKPTDELINRFHLFGNVLCVLHPHPHLDGRVFDYIESQLDSNQYRLDKLCVILISNASTVEENVKRISVEAEARIFVPFRYQEFSGGTPGKHELMLNRLTEHLYTKNLFGISSALKTDRYFFGRKADVQRLVGKYQSGENGSIFGLRRIGKTSVLWAVVRELNINGVPVAFIDCSDTRYHGTTWNHTLYQIKNSLFESNKLKGAGHKITDYSPNNASVAFQKDLELIRNKFGKPVLLILDEIENISFGLSPSQNWSSGHDYLFFWQTIRSIFQQNTNLFTFQICGVNPHIIEIPILPDGRDNPIYRYIEPNYLGFFNVENVTEMVSIIGGYMGLQFDNEIFTYLTDDYGGHPFLIRQVCSRIYETQTVSKIPRQFKIKKESYKADSNEFAKFLSDYVDLILKILIERYTDEYKLLQYLAAKDFETFSTFATEPSWISHLIGYGLITKVNEKYFFRISVVEESVARQSTHLRTPDTVEEMWSLMSQERNSFESQLREVVRQTLKVIHGATDAKQKIIDSMNKSSQKTKAESLKYDDIFKGELYFNDLKKVIEVNWQQFEQIFNHDKVKMSKSMTLANKYRIDAHAKSITTEQYRDAMTALCWLKDALTENT